METTSNKWFWPVIGIIVLITIAAIIYCNKKEKSIVSPSDPSDDLGVIDQIPSLQNVIS